MATATDADATIYISLYFLWYGGIVYREIPRKRYVADGIHLCAVTIPYRGQLAAE